jgi:uncharacterized protein YbjT (DUF2867 family)
MKILVVGATGGLGRDIVTGALAHGHATAALARDPSRAVLPPVVEVVAGDVLDPSSLRPALIGREAVICAVGTPSPRKPSTLLREGTENLVGAMSDQDVWRLVCVTLLGTGASRTNCSLIYRGLTLRVLAPMLPDKEAQEQLVRASDLDWVLVRPPRFTGRRAGGNLRVLREGQRGRVGHVAAPTLRTSWSNVPPAPSTRANRSLSGPDAWERVQLNRWTAARLAQSCSPGCSPVAS